MELLKYIYLKVASNNKKSKEEYRLEPRPRIFTKNRKRLDRDIICIFTCFRVLFGVDFICGEAKRTLIIELTLSGISISEGRPSEIFLRLGARNHALFGGIVQKKREREGGGREKVLLVESFDALLSYLLTCFYSKIK